MRAANIVIVWSFLCWQNWNLLHEEGSGAAVVSALDTKTFPRSTRDALLAKSKQINPSSSNLSPSGWSNRAGTVLTPIHVEGVYTADRPFYWNSIDVGCRSTIIELPSSSSTPELFVHSPVSLDGSMLESIRKLGNNVKHVMTPNYEHTKFAFMWYQNYKDTASMWGCPGLSERIPEIPWKGEIPYHYRPKGWQGGKGSNSEIVQVDPEGLWDTDILQCLHIDIETNPFTGRPFFNEVIFYHVPTKTLLTTDLFWNYPSNDGIVNSQFGQDDSWELAPNTNGVPWKSQLFKFGMDKVYYPFFNTLMVTNKDEYRAIANHILNVWDVETVIPAHGDILRGKDLVRSVLTRYFQLD